MLQFPLWVTRGVKIASTQSVCPQVSAISTKSSKEQKRVLLECSKEHERWIGSTHKKDFYTIGTDSTEAEFWGVK